MNFDNSFEYAKFLDRDDELKSFREKFIIPTNAGKQQIYFLGNSLGLQPKSCRNAIEKVLEQWSQHGVEAFFIGDEPWYHFHEMLAKPLAGIIGSSPDEMVVMNQLTVNLHLMMASFYRPERKKNKIICEAKAFPSDQYMLETFLSQRGLDPEEIILEIHPREGEYLIREEDIVNIIRENSDQVAMVFFGGVNYFTGQVFDLKLITEAAHNAGAIAGFDLAHAVGNVQLKLHDWDVDFACWCSYKYLNSGPGAIGGAYIHERFHKDQIHRLAGWWGYDKQTRFKMEKGFKPIPTAEGWQLSTPSIILYAMHKAALDVFEEAGMDKIFSKSKLLSDYLFFLLEDLCNRTDKGRFEIITPRDPLQKGSQVSILTSNNGKEIFEELTKRGIFSDWREPNVIRVAPVPLYNTFEEVWRFVDVVGSLSV